MWGRGIAGKSYDSGWEVWFEYGFPKLGAGTSWDLGIGNFKR